MYTTPVLITITDSLTVYTVEWRVERMGEMYNSLKFDNVDEPGKRINFNIAMYWIAFYTCINSFSFTLFTVFYHKGVTSIQASNCPKLV